ncbi:MAG: hypothetical protein HZB26_24685 [Candidatus Hydrogenedentes bacterium]|nr:hypothetical protein [Candidatus Hydrogenedentota bacterium]
MNCQEAQKYLDDLLVTGIDKETESVLEEHAVSCVRCRREMESARRTLTLLQPSVMIETSTTLKEKIMNKIEAAEIAAPYMRQPSQLRNLLWKPAFAAAAVVVAILAGIVMMGKQTTPVYALEQTIEANQGLRAIHMRMTPQSFGHVGEIWAQFDENGELANLRMNFPDTEDGPKDVVWGGGKAQVWFKKKGSSVVVKEEQIVERLKQEFGTFDPKLIVEGIYRKQAEGSLNLEVSEPASAGEPIVLTVSVDRAPNRRDIYRVDPETKLLLTREVYRMKDGVNALVETTEYLDYNEPIADEVFTLDVPHDAVQIDQTTHAVGLVQGNLSNEEIAVKVVREFFTALIKKDYATAGQLMEGMPADKVKETFGRGNFTRIISIGTPTPYAPNQSLKVPCKIEVEREGKTSVFEPFGPFVRQVYGQPDRWTICGGI